MTDHSPAKLEIDTGSPQGPHGSWEFSYSHNSHQEKIAKDLPAVQPAGGRGGVAGSSFINKDLTSLRSRSAH